VEIKNYFTFYFCLHTVLETAWRETKSADPDAASYEMVVSDLCRYVKQATGIQEQLPKSLKHGGDTRPCISMHRRADAVEASYETLVNVLTTPGKYQAHCHNTTLLLSFYLHIITDL